MLNKIKQGIRNRIHRLINFEKIYEFEKLNKLPNVYIHPEHRLQLGTLFNISEKAGTVRFEKYVGCRNYCNFMVYPDAVLIIREGVHFNNYCSVNCLGNIEIGENTLVGEGVKLYDHNHKYAFSNSSLLVSKDEFTIGKIKIGKNCWLGSNVTVLKDVEIGDNVIIGANCLIYKSIPANSIVKANTNYIIESKV